MMSQGVELTQENALVAEREALHRLPRLLGDLLDEADVRVDSACKEKMPNLEIDLCARDSRGRLWLVEVKASSRPGQVKSAAQQLHSYANSQSGIAVLLVPHMTPGGARAAEEENLNWIDFAGNASIRDENLHVWVQGRPSDHRPRGRPASPFAPRSARITRELLLHPGRWWRQRDLAEVTGLNDGTVSRVVRRLAEELLIENRDRMVRAHDPGLLLDAWAADYRFDKHDIVEGHLTGAGIDLARTVATGLGENAIRHAFTGLPAAWVTDAFAQFRLTTVYVEGDPRNAAEALGLRRYEKGANVQLVGPNDDGVFAGGLVHNGLDCVSAVQTYLDLQHLPERAPEAADHLRTTHLNWSGQRG